MAYRASIGGAFGGGAGAPASHPIDIGGALDALTSGASTLIQNAYMRKQASAKLAMEQQQRDQEAQWHSEQNRINAQRFAADHEYRMGQLKVERMKALGYDDSNDTPSAPNAPSTPAPTAPIAQSYQNSYQDDGTVGMAPPAAAQPMPASAPVPRLNVPISAPSGAPTSAVPTPPRISGYDPTRDINVLRETAKENARLAARLNMAPQLASADSAKTVNTAKGMIPVRVAQAAQEAQATAPIKTAQEVEAQRQKNALDNPTALRGEAKSFASANKPLSDAVVQYAAAKNAFAEARAGNPAALKSAILGFASVADSKAQLRQGVIKMVEQVDPSIKGNFELAINRLGSGTLPPRVLNDMEKLVERTHATHKALYDQRRAAEVVRHPGLDNYIPKSDEVFNVPGISGTAAPQGTNPFMSLPKAKQP